MLRVEFYLNGALLESDTTSPYSIVRTDLPRGPQQRLQARAVLVAGGALLSPVTTVRVGHYVPADFNNDGYPDLVFEDAGGHLKVWYMQGLTRLAEAGITLSPIDPVWKIVGLYDFNDDWKTDILWQKDGTNDVVVWYMDGVSYVSYTVIWSANGWVWRVSAVGDIDDDGSPELVWTNPHTGERFVWYMDGATPMVWLPYGYFNGVPVVGTDWRIVSLADLNGDGREDLVWQHVGGAFAYWLLDDRTIIGSGPLDPPAVADPTWQVQAVANFDRAGGQDLYFQNTTTLQLYLWNLVGTTLTTHGWPSHQPSGTEQLRGGR